MTTQLKILQLNTNHSRAPTVVLAQFILENSIDIALVQDPYVQDGRLQGFPGLWQTYPSKDYQAWIVIATPGLNASAPIAFQSSVFVTLVTTEGLLTIGTQYAAPSADFKEAINEWSPLLQSLDENASFFLGGDLNARSPLWGVRL